MSRLLALVVLLAAAPALGQPVLLQQLSSPDSTPEGRFGSAVALGGDVIVVGEPGEAGALGRAFVFARAPGAGTWALEGELFPRDIEDAGEFRPAFGAAAAFDGTNALIGAPYESSEVINSGAAYLFRQDEQTGAWTDVAKFKAPVPVLRDQFGAAVAISGTAAAVGAFGDDEAGENAGAVYLFTQDAESGAWAFSQKLIPDDAEAGDRFGFSLALRGDVLVVGISSELGPAVPGAAYVFERTGDAASPWEQTQKLGAEVAEPGEAFGFDVAVSGTTIFVGAPMSDPVDQGAAYVFERAGGPEPWQQTQRLIAMSPQTNAQFGTSVSVDGDHAVVGAPLDGTQVSAGAAYTFERVNSTWVPANHLSADEPEENAFFGRVVAVRSGLTVVGSPDAGAENAGAAYVYSLLPTAAADTPAGAFGLGAPYPNPVRASATLTYTLAVSGYVTLSAFDVLGREVAVLEAGRRPAGSSSVRWDTRGLPAGVYVVRLASDDRTATRKVLVVR